MIFDYWRISQDVAAFMAKWRDPRVAPIKKITAVVATQLIAGRYNARNREGRDCVFVILEPETTEADR